MNEETTSSKKELSESTFERLHDLQILLKKESAMKELCKRYNYKYNKYSHKNKRRNKKANKRRMYINIFEKIRSK